MENKYQEIYTLKPIGYNFDSWAIVLSHIVVTLE
jgi:hypothetical protein